jgi:tRNA (guanine37-N1)-methyltransferase
MDHGPHDENIPARILERGLATLRIHYLRDWGIGRHRSVVDSRFCGGPGMILRVEPVVAAFVAVRRPNSLVILPDPAGSVFTHDQAAELASRDHLVLVCPRYEGVDDRIRAFIDLELSIGVYVVSGGELPALVIIDAVIRLLPGAIDSASTEEESFSQGLLEYPQYTRPSSFRGIGVPDVLTSGDHGAVARWRHDQAMQRTRERRPELLSDDL